MNQVSRPRDSLARSYTRLTPKKCVKHVGSSLIVAKDECVDRRWNSMGLNFLTEKEEVVIEVLGISEAFLELHRVSQFLCVP